MLFHTFSSQEERRSFGGSAFLELQFCVLPSGTAPEELVSIDHITHWKNDSLYIQDENTFYREYGRIFRCGLYNNLKHGPVDLYGINYYAPCSITPILEAIRQNQPAGHELVSKWLNQAKAYNGFYILGI